MVRLVIWDAIVPIMTSLKCIWNPRADSGPLCVFNSYVDYDDKWSSSMAMNIISYGTVEPVYNDLLMG